MSGMSTRPEHVYTPRGQTRKPCPACGQEGKARPTNGVCYDCERKLARYDELVAALAAAAGERQAYHVTQYGQYYHIPGHDTRGPYSRTDGPRDQMEQAMLALAEAVGEIDRRPGAQMAPTGNSPKLWTDFAGQHHDWYHGTRRLYTPEAAAAFDALDRAIRAAVAAAWHEGRKYGVSLLGQLAAGEIAVEDFNQRTTEGAK